MLSATLIHKTKRMRGIITVRSYGHITAMTAILQIPTHKCTHYFVSDCHLRISAVWVIIISYTYFARISAEKGTHMANTKSMGRDLNVGSVPKVLLAFAAPLFLSNFLQAVYSMVDMVVVGKYVGTNGLSSVSIGSEMLHFLTFLAMGFANAGQVIIAQYTGAGQRDKIKRLIGTMFTFLAICAVVMTIAAMFLCENIMDWLNTPDLARDGARSYIMTCAVGLLFIYGYNMVSAVLRGMGDSKHPFMFIGIAAVLNLVLLLMSSPRSGWVRSARRLRR